MPLDQGRNTPVRTPPKSGGPPPRVPGSTRGLPGDPTVARAQLGLRRAGYNVTVDGVNGPQTQAAMQHFNATLPQRITSYDRGVANMLKTRYTEPPQRMPVASVNYDPGLRGTARLDHAIQRMHNEGWNENAIRGQIKNWHPGWSEARILNRMNAARPVRTTYAPGSVNYAQAQLAAHPSFEHADLPTAELQQLHRAASAPVVQMVGGLANPITYAHWLASSKLGVAPVVGSARQLAKHPSLGGAAGLGLNTAMAAAVFMPLGEAAPGVRAALEARGSGATLADSIAAGHNAWQTARAAIPASRPIFAPRPSRALKTVMPALEESTSRNAVHTQIDNQIKDPAVATVIKHQWDEAAASQATQAARQETGGTLKSRQQAHASDLYDQVQDPGKGIRHYRNAFVEAERNPHYSPLPEGVRPLNAEETQAHIEKSIADAKRMTSVEKDPAVLTSVFEEAHRLVAKGALFRKWYEISGKRILDHVHGDKEEANKLAQLFGIYSANRDVPANSVLAMRAYDQARSGLPITEGSGDQIRTATKVMKGEPWAGRKTNTFYSNMLKHIDPQRFLDEFPTPADRAKATVDVWMNRMFGLKGKSPTNAQYTWIENHIKELGRQLGWSPEEAQAAAWVALKSETEGTSLERAAYDFGHGIDTHVGQVDLQAASPHGRAVITPDGRNLVHEAIGVPGVGQQIPLLRTKGPGGDYTISAAERQMAEQSAAAHGFVLNLDKVPYGRSFQAKSLGHANAIELDVPGGINDDLAKKISVATGAELAHRPNGAWLLKPEGEDAKAWVKQSEEALRSVDPALVRQATAVVHDGGTIAKGEYGSHLDKIEDRQPGSGQALRRLKGDVAWANLDRGAGRPGRDVYGSRVPPQHYLEARGRGSNARSWNFSEHQLDDLRDHITVLSPDRKAGYMVSPDGNLQGVFNNPGGIKGQGARMVNEAVNVHGAKTLDAYDGFLPDFYREHGFVETARLKFDPAYAPEGMPAKEAAKKPDIVFMALDATEHPNNYVGSWQEGEQAAAAVAQERVSFDPKTPMRISSGGSEIDRAGVEQRVEQLQRQINAAEGFEHPAVVARLRQQLDHLKAILGEEDQPAPEDVPAAEPGPEPLPDETLARTHEPLPAETPEQQLMRGLRSARSHYGKEKVLKQEDRAKRIAEVDKALRTISDPDEARAAAADALRGELPTIDFHGLTTLNDSSLRYLKQYVNQHPTLLPMMKFNINEALDAAVKKGIVPRPYEMRMIEHVFNKKTAMGVVQTAGTNSLGETALNVMNIPRSMMATLDLSAAFRQGLVAGASHPIIWGRSFPTMVKSWANPRVYEREMQRIESDPLYPLALAGHISFTDLGEHAAGLNAREDAFASDYAARIPVVGHAIKGSARAYTVFLNKVRMDMFEQQIRIAQAAGNDIHNEKFLQALGRVINAATGRGTPPERLEDWLPAANALMFSPRLMLSRINYLDPTWYYRLGRGVRNGEMTAAEAKQVRIEALRGLFATSAAVMSALYLFSRIPGVSVGSMDPRSADFGKLKFGNTRIDIAGGFQQYIRLASVLATQTTISSTTGKKTKLGSGYGKPTAWDEITKFFLGKASPPLAMGVELLNRKDPLGNKLKVLPTHSFWDTMVAQYLTPLVVQDAHDLYKERHGGVNGIEWALAGYGLGAFGLGMQTYAPKPPTGRGGGGGGLGGGLGSSLSGGGLGSSLSGGGGSDSLGGGLGG